MAATQTVPAGALTWGNGDHYIVTAASTGTVTVWADWCSAASTSTGTQWGAWNTTWTQTQEQHAAREQAQAQAVLRHQEAAQARVAARERALELLGYVLSPQQMATYRDHGWFEVTSSRGRRWRVRDRGQAGNVDLMPETGGERLASYCAHPPGGLPDPDAHLAQALQLVTDEDGFLAVANCQYRRPAAA